MIDSDFTVQLHRSGGSVHVGRHETILAALGRAGLRVPSSCTAGICGVCETRVISGTPLHRDQILSPLSTQSIMICCSRSKTSVLVLDL